jgi:hypothetical protein
LSQIKPADFSARAFQAIKKIRLEPEPSRARLESITNIRISDLGINILKKKK